jgi:hypothetical protein
MANIGESVEKYAVAVLSGSVMALALLLIGDGLLGGVFAKLGSIDFN